MSTDRNIERPGEWERLLEIDRRHARERETTARREAWTPGAVMRAVVLPEEVLYRFRRIERAARGLVLSADLISIPTQESVGLLRHELERTVFEVPPSEPVGMRGRPKSDPCIQVAGDWLMERPVGEAINDLLALMRARPEAALAAIAAFEFDETGETLR